MLFTGLSGEFFCDYGPKSTNWRFCTKGSKQEEKNEVALSRRGEGRLCQMRQSEQRLRRETALATVSRPDNNCKASKNLSVFEM